jgi:hypothetical protein
MSQAIALLLQAVSRANEDFLLGQPRYADPRSLVPFRSQMYSQNGEDGAIAEMLRRVGVHSRRFLEIGAGDGMQNNTRFLLELGWSGTWCECEPANVQRIRTAYQEQIESGQLRLVSEPIMRENVARLLDGMALGVDVLSVDIDMNTSHAWRALGNRLPADCQPRIAVVEYNPAVPPSVEWEVAYDPAAVWPGGRRFGASLKRLEMLGRKKGYSLVGCELTGINAFFVRTDLADPAKFLAPFTSEQHYEPPRFALMWRDGHERLVVGGSPELEEAAA